MLIAEKIKQALQSDFVIIALACIAFLFFAAPHFSAPFNSSDEELYAWQALRIAKNSANFFDEEIFLLPYIPLFPALASPLALFMHPVSAVRAIAVVFSLLAITATFFLGKKIGGREAGAIAVFLLALNPIFLFFGAKGFMESGVAFFAALMAVFLLSRGTRRQFGAMAAVIAASIFKMPVVFLALPLLLATALRAIKAGGGGERKALALGLAGTLCIIALVASAYRGAGTLGFAEPGLGNILDITILFNDIFIVMIGAAASVFLAIGLARMSSDKRTIIALVLIGIGAGLFWNVVVQKNVYGMGAVSLENARIDVMALPILLAVAGFGISSLAKNRRLSIVPKAVIALGTAGLLFAAPSAHLDMLNSIEQKENNCADYAEWAGGLERDAGVFVAGDEFEARAVLLETEIALGRKASVGRLPEEEGKFPGCLPDTLVVVASENPDFEDERRMMGGRWIFDGNIEKNLAGKGFVKEREINWKSTGAKYADVYRGNC